MKFASVQDSDRSCESVNVCIGHTPLTSELLQEHDALRPPRDDISIGVPPRGVFEDVLCVGLDVYENSIMVAYAPGKGEVELLGKIGTSKTDIDRPCERLQSKVRRISVDYEAGPCGYGLYRQLVQKGFDCMVCPTSLIPRKPGERIKTGGGTP